MKENKFTKSLKEMMNKSYLGKMDEEEANMHKKHKEEEANMHKRKEEEAKMHKKIEEEEAMMLKSNSRRSKSRIQKRCWSLFNKPCSKDESSWMGDC